MAANAQIQKITALRHSEDSEKFDVTVEYYMLSDPNTPLAWYTENTEYSAWPSIFEADPTNSGVDFDL